MTKEAFILSLSESQPPTDCGDCLKALWHDANGNWHLSHELVQDLSTAEAAWVHAYLHRKEGDPGNARYWYQRAGKTYTTQSLEAEWESIVSALLKH